MLFASTAVSAYMATKPGHGNILGVSALVASCN